VTVVELNKEQIQKIKESRFLLTDGDSLTITLLIDKIEKLEKGIEKFTSKNFHGGSKSDREDYATMVSCKDIWDLRELIK
jgi:hypothetical protein